MVHTAASSNDSPQDDIRQEQVKIKAMMIKDAMQGRDKTDAVKEASEMPDMSGGCWGGLGPGEHEV